MTAIAECFSVTAGPEEAGRRVDRFLADAIGTLSRSRVKSLIEAGHATQDGAPLREPAQIARVGVCYALTLPAPVAATPVPRSIPLAIVFEDADLLVIDKPAGLVVHPAPGHADDTLVNALLAHCGDSLTGIGGERRPGIVHRLDKDTSGLLVVAKTALAHQALAEGFAARVIDRHYLALCWGVPAMREAVLSGPIGRDPRDRKRMAVVAGGRAAITRYRVRAVARRVGESGAAALGPAVLGAVALLECRLATGRTHQIRVHLSADGHPLVGDPVYLRRRPAVARLLAEPVRDALLGFPRQALHAASLGFRHPRSGAALAFTSPMPADLGALLALVGIDPY